MTVCAMIAQPPARRVRIALALWVGAGLVLGERPVAGQQGATAPPAAVVHRPVRPTYGNSGTVDVIPVQGRVYLLAGAGANVVVQVGDDDLFVVDTNEAAMSGKMLEAIRSISKLPIRYIVNTSGDPDRVGGNEALAKSAGTNVNQFLNQGARVYAQENAYNRVANPRDGTPLPVALWPTDAFLGPKKSLFVTGEPIELIHQPKAHTDGDVMVFFRKSDVVAAGGIFVLSSYPVIDVKHGGSFQGIIDGLNRLVDLAIPEFNAMGGTRIVPGNGRIANEIDVVEYRDAMTIVRDRVAAMVAEGRTFDEVKAARVSLDYDGIYGTTSGPWTTEMFLDTVYKELSVSVPRTSRRAPTTRTPQAAAAPTAKPAPRRQSSDPFDGLWALNTARSRYEPVNTTPYRREINLIVTGDEVTQETSTWRRGLGNNSPLARVSYTAKLDGREYPVPASTSKVTLRRVSPATIERAATGDGSAKETATWSLSPDRKVLTIETAGVDSAGTKYSSTQVYDRLP